jgi:hypothetical protein
MLKFQIFLASHLADDAKIIASTIKSHKDVGIFGAHADEMAVLTHGVDTINCHHAISAIIARGRCDGPL